MNELVKILLALTGLFCSLSPTVATKLLAVKTTSGCTCPDVVLKQQPHFSMRECELNYFMPLVSCVRLKAKVVGMDTE